MGAFSVYKNLAHTTIERLFMRILSIFVLGLFVALGSLTAHAQEWKTSQPAEHHEAVVQIVAGGAMGSGSVVRFLRFQDKSEDYYVALILTASHVVSDPNMEITIRFNSGEVTTGGEVVKKTPYGRDGFNDLCVIRALVPSSIKPIEMYDGAEIDYNTQVELAGYGHKCGFRHWNAPYGGDIYKSDGHVVFTWGIQGDSGGPVLLDGKVIGVICYGASLDKHIDTKRFVVGPVFSSNVGRVKNFILEYEEEEE